MADFTVEQVSDALGKSPETVRRLVRTDKIQVPTRSSSKAEIKIPEESLKKFLSETPKYMTTKAANLLSNNALPIAMAGIIAAIVASFLSGKSKKISADQVKKYVEKEIQKNESLVATNVKEINILKAKTKSLEAELERAEQQIANYKKALAELDFEDIAENINANRK